jgi:hypothetical protein
MIFYTDGGILGNAEKNMYRFWDRVQGLGPGGRQRSSREGGWGLGPGGAARRAGEETGGGEGGWGVALRAGILGRAGGRHFK